MYTVRNDRQIGYCPKGRSTRGKTRQSLFTGLIISFAHVVGTNACRRIQSRLHRLLVV